MQPSENRNYPLTEQQVFDIEQSLRIVKVLNYLLTKRLCFVTIIKGNLKIRTDSVEPPFTTLTSHLFEIYAILTCYDD